MALNLSITDADGTDAEAIGDLAKVIWNACYPGIITREQIDYMLGWMYAPERIRAEINDEAIRYLLVRKGDRLIGFGAFGPGGDESETFIHKLYIDPAIQRQGIGTAVMLEIERRACDAGIRQLSLRVNRKNHSAIAAYEKCGFQKKGEVCSDIGGGFVMDDFLMTKSLA